MPSSTHPPEKSGVSWLPERGRLYRFTRFSVTVIEPWPSVRCWQRHGRQGTWRGAWPDIRLDLLEEGTSAPYPYRFEQAAWSSVPADIRARVLQASFRDRQWNTLCFLARCQGASKLIDEQPLLAAAAANLKLVRSIGGHPTPSQPWRDLRAATRKGRSRDTWRRVARLLRWPEDPSLLRVLRRVGPLAPQTWEVATVGELPSIWRSPWLRKILQHGPALTPGFLSALAAAAEFATLGGVLPARLFLDLADAHESRNLSGAIRGLSAAAQETPFAPLPPAAALASLEAIEQATAALLPQRAPMASFPAPPLRGTPTIVPLTTPQALVVEGSAMQHCIGGGGFANRARAMTGFGYGIRDAAGARLATAWIEPSSRRAGAFLLGQLQGPRNSEVDSPVRSMVEQWLDDSAQAHMLRAGGASARADGLAPPIHEDWAPRPGMSSQDWLRMLRQRRQPHYWHVTPPPDHIAYNDDIPF